VSYTLADYGEACLAVNRFNVAKRAFKKALEGTNKNPEHFSDDFIQRIANGSTL